jgi:4-diphosphocytidyl-2-C-methyl-D-erythritol kinase
MPITERAAAKINLYLHVTGKRADGYHLLDSLVVFAGIGDAAADVVMVEEAKSFALTIDGPYGHALAGEDVQNNLITKAVMRLAEKKNRRADVVIHLIKNLPLASGIGGGSADAAAALRALAKIWELDADDPDLREAARQTGADMTACLINHPLYFGGIGDEIEEIPRLPAMGMLLVNPNAALPTAPVFKARQGDFTPANRLRPMPVSPQDFADALATRRNDLETPAMHICPAVGDVLTVLRQQKNILLARMSGSGATCFGLFETVAEAQEAAALMKAQHPQWWVAPTGF